jgi:hypothetical protein
VIRLFAKLLLLTALPQAARPHHPLDQAAVLARNMDEEDQLARMIDVEINTCYDCDDGCNIEDIIIWTENFSKNQKVAKCCGYSHTHADL